MSCIQETLDLLRASKTNGHVLVYGLGVTGKQVISFLERERITWKAVDESRKPIEEFNRSNCYLLSEVDLQRSQLLDDASMIIVSPGVAIDSPLLQQARNRKLPIFSDLEIAMPFYSGPLIGITGSNGKSTVATLTHHFFKQAGINSLLAGNIGSSPLTFLTEGVVETGAVRNGVGVWECSSYQLEHSKALPFQTATLLNLSENHFARHKNMQQYLEAKARIFSSPSVQNLLLNGDDPNLEGLHFDRQIIKVGRNSSATRIEFDPRNSVDRIHIQLSGESFLLDCSHTKLLGFHSRVNIAFSALMALLHGCPLQAIQEALPTFQPLSHRMQTTLKGAHIFINDSKSTTVASTVAALDATVESFPESGIHLLVGGILKGGSLKPLADSIARHSSSLKSVTCFGADQHLLREAVEEVFPQVLGYSKLEGAMKNLVAQLEQHQVVLFSPGGASFDEFKSFEDRGSVFQSYLDCFSL